MIEPIKIYNLICKNKNKWIEMNFGISNKVYSYENKYIIKIINKSNDNLFLSLINYYTILEKLDTTIYLDKINNIIIEKYIDGNIISNNLLFEPEFSTKIFDLIDNSLYILDYPIEKTNVIIKYISQLSQYISDKNIFALQVKKMNNIVLPIINKYIDEKANLRMQLYFSHNDIQKYNIIISSDNKINLIDFEYSGYTWKYFDHLNFIGLLLNEAIANKFDMIINNNLDGIFLFNVNYFNIYLVYMVFSKI